MTADRSPTSPTTTTDALDAHIAAACSRHWPGPARNTRVEEFLMIESRKAERSSPRRLSLWIGAGLLAVTGAVYGGARMYERYTVRVEANGVTSEHQVEAGPDGTAMLEVPMEGGGHAKVLVGRENVGPDGQIHVSVESYQGNGGEFTGDATVQVSSDGTPLVEKKDQKPPK